MRVRVERAGPVTTIVLCRPEARNAVDRATADELSNAFAAFEQDETASVAVLCGDGDTFCAGADLKAFATGQGANRVEAEGDGPMGPTRRTLTKPAIAAVEGYAVAGGLELALFCDLRVAAEDATFGVFCRRFGVPLIDGGTVRLPRLIGLSRALDLILTGRPVTAQEAVQMGLVNRVVAKGTARAEAERLARDLASLPQECLRNDRLSAYEQQDLDFDAALRNEFRRGLRSLQANALDGARSFAKGEGRHGETIINTTGRR
jgi:enoyl-CoA hydratase